MSDKQYSIELHRLEIDLTEPVKSFDNFYSFKEL